MKISRLHVVIIDCLVPIAFLVCYITSRFMHSLSIICYVKKMGFECPACGGTRCVISFTDFDFVSSFNYNPYIFITIIFTAITLVFMNVTVFSESQTCEKLFTKLISFRLVIIWAIGFVLFGIIRNFI